MYLEIDEGFPGHRKTLRLCAALKNPEAAWYVIRLWTWACRSCPTGDLAGMDPYDIEIAVQYRPLDGACYAAMVLAGFVDEADGRPVSIHNWMERTGGAIAKMADAARRKKAYRAHKDGQCDTKCGWCDVASEDGQQDNPRTVVVTSTGQTDTDKTSPDKTSPDPDSLPAPARDPGATGTVAITGPYLTQLFGRIRNEETGAGFEWSGTPTSPEKAATQAAIVADSGNAIHVESSMRLLFAKAKRGEIDEAAKILRSPAFAFGSWCSEFVPLVEEVTGTAPAIPIRAAAARAGPRAAAHETTHAAAARFLERQKSQGAE